LDITELNSKYANCIIILTLNFFLKQEILF
jgi:hypothetical protein